jgi:hypothetical protein
VTKAPPDNPTENRQDQNISVGAGFCGSIPARRVMSGIKDTLPQKRHDFARLSSTNQLDLF